MSARSRRILLGILHSSLLTLLASTAVQAAPTGVEAYGALPKYDDMQLSPSGARLALVQTDGSQRVIAVVSLADGKPLAGARVGEEKLRGIEWADEDHLLIYRSVTGKLPRLMLNPEELRNVLLFDVRTSKTTSLPVLGKGDSLLNMVESRPTARQIDGQTVLFFQGVSLRLDKSNGAAVPVLVRYDVDSSAQHVIRSGTPTTREWSVDDTGRVNAVVDYDQQKQQWKLSTVIADNIKTVQTGNSAVEIPEVGPGADPNTLLVRMLQNDTMVYRTLTMGTGVLSDPGVLPDESGPIYDAYTHRLIGHSGVTDSRQYHFTDPARQSTWDSVTKLFAGAHVQLVSASADFKKLVLLIDGHDQGYTYRLADLGTGRVTLLGNVYADIKVFNEVRPITYAAADGLPIRAYLTLPDGHPPSKLPLVVLVHGGPADRDTADFEWFGQAFASQGYAVLRANYRGSAIGYRLISAGFGEWGRKMQTDVSDGVKYLAAQGIVDPARVCIVGASYGGYAALAGVSLQSNIYRCAVSVAGPGNLQVMLRYASNYDAESTERYWDRFMGVSGPNDPALAKISPYDHVDAISVPVLLIHGKDDTVVPYEQSELMAAALKRAGKSVEFVTLNREDHWLSRPETRTQMLQSSVDFLRKYNPPD